MTGIVPMIPFGKFLEFLSWTKLTKLILGAIQHTEKCRKDKFDLSPNLKLVFPAFLNVCCIAPSMSLVSWS